SIRGGPSPKSDGATSKSPGWLPRPPVPITSPRATSAPASMPAADAASIEASSSQPARLPFCFDDPAGEAAPLAHRHLTGGTVGECCERRHDLVDGGVAAAIGGADLALPSLRSEPDPVDVCLAVGEGGDDLGEGRAYTTGSGGAMAGRASGVH